MAKRIRTNWPESLERKVVKLRKQGIHPYVIADKLGLCRIQVEAKLKQLKHANEYIYPRLHAGPKRKWTKEIIQEWRDRVNKGKTQRERSAIKRELALEFNTSYEVVYQRCSHSWVFHEDRTK